MAPLSLQNIKNRLARLYWLPGVSCLITLNSQKLDAGKRFFAMLHENELLSVDNENGHLLKARIPQRHRLDPLANIFAEHVLDMRLYSELLLHGLLTGRQKKQQEFADSIIQKCLTFDLLEELTGWGLTLKGWLETKLYGDIPVILFQLYHGETRLSNIALDGWSGLILVNGSPTSFSLPKAFSEAEDLHPLVRKEADAYLEEITS